MQALPQDLKYGLRMLLRKPLLTVVLNYFKTMGMTLIAGREFTDQDKEGYPAAQPYGA